VGLCLRKKQTKSFCYRAGTLMQCTPPARELECAWLPLLPHAGTQTIEQANAVSKGRQITLTITELASQHSIQCAAPGLCVPAPPTVLLLQDRPSAPQLSFVVSVEYCGRGKARGQRSTAVRSGQAADAAVQLLLTCLNTLVGSVQLGATETDSRR
jgi:hypothetical protein